MPVTICHTRSLMAATSSCTRRKRGRSRGVTTTITATSDTISAPSAPAMTACRPTSTGANSASRDKASGRYMMPGPSSVRTSFRSLVQREMMSPVRRRW